MRRPAWLALTVAVAGCGWVGGGPEAAEPGARLEAAEMPPVGRAAVRRLSFPPLEFDPPRPERFELSNGATVYFLEDGTLPLVDVLVNVRGGYVYLDRERYAAASGLLPLMRYGGTETFTVDSLDDHIAFHSLGVSTSTDGTRMVVRVNGMRRQLDQVVEVWSDILLRPRFDPDAVERWRLQELEAIRRRSDFPGSLAVLALNGVIYGDHPNGWQMTAADLAPGKIDSAQLRRLHTRTVCPEHAVIGAAGAVEPDSLRATLERALAGWEPCGTELGDPPAPVLESDRRVYVIHRASGQSTVAVGQPGGVVMAESMDYFASQLANWIIGGSTFTSRLMDRVRAEEGLAYTAASIWGAAATHPRIFGAITHTRPDRTVEVARLVLRTLEEVRRDPPGTEEVARARRAIVNGYVFGFGSAAQIVSRQVSYRADGLPEDWLTRYFQGIQKVEAGDVARVIRRHIHPDEMTILIVGDTTAFDASVLGPVTTLGSP